MIRRIVIFFICIIVANLVSFYETLDETNKNIDTFEEYVNKECIDYQSLDEIRVVFDYEKIDLFIKNNNYNIQKKEISKTNFIVIIEVKKGVFHKTIKEEIFIRRGDMYDGGN